MDAALLQAPDILQTIMEDIRATRCSATHSCNLRCFCDGHRECGRLVKYGRLHESYHARNCGVMDGTGRCRGHACRRQCDVEMQKRLNDLIAKCQEAAGNESSPSPDKFFLETIFLPQLLKMSKEFKTQCGKRFDCSLRCLGCSDVADILIWIQGTARIMHRIVSWCAAHRSGNAVSSICVDLEAPTIISFRRWRSSRSK